jgi:prolipoprotein diacylglyceryltransferase
MLRVIGEFFLGGVILVIVLYISQHYPLIAHRLVSVFVVLAVLNYCVLRVKYELLRGRFVKIAKLEKKRKELLTPPEH